MQIENPILFRSIRGYLFQLSDVVAKNNILGRFNINRDSEDLVAKLLNIIFNLNLINANDERQNFPAIDLIDRNKKVSVQVSSTSNSSKINKTVTAFDKYKYYNFFEKLLFYFLTNRVPNFNTVTRNNVKLILSNHINFDFSTDIYNNSTIGFEIEKLTDNNLLLEIESILAEALALPDGGKMDIIRGYIIPKKLNPYAGFSINELVGRTNILGQINEKFDSSKIVLLSGLGGIGKTTIARAYLEAHKNMFDHLSYIDISTNIVESLLFRLSDADKSFERDSRLTSIDNLKNLIQKIRTIYNTLLVLDNCENEDELRELKPILESIEWSILITTRTRPINYINETIEVGPLPPSDLFKIFTNLYNPKNDEEHHIISQIISDAHYHTKLVILLAKAAKSNPLLSLKELSKLVTQNAYQAQGIDIVVDLNQEEKSVYAFILALFKPEMLLGYERHYIRFFSILPSREIPINHLFELFEGETLEKQAYLLNTLRTLFNKGWIEKYSNDYYRIHPLVQLVVQRKLNIKVTEIYPLIDNLLELFENSLEPIHLEVYLPYCESITSYFKNVSDLKLALILNKMSWIYRELSLYAKAIDSNLLALNNLGNSKDTQLVNQVRAQSYGYLFISYLHIGNFIEAEKYGLLCINLQEDILPASHSDLLATYNNIANLYRQLNKHEEALLYIDKIIGPLKLTYIKNFNKMDAFNLLNTYTTFASIVADIGNFDKNNVYLKKAIFADFKGLIIANRILSPNSKRIATLYNNISLTYRDLECFNDSLKYLDKAILIQESILSNNHPDLALSYYNKGILFERLHEPNTAIGYAKHALSIQENKFLPDHPNVISTKELINRLEDLINKASE
jgi:hypothetical protein